MGKNEIIELIQQSFDALFDAELISEKVNVNLDTVLLGTNSELDSIAFITLFSEIEDRIADNTGNEMYLVLSEIHDFNSDKTSLNVEVLVEYIFIKLQNHE